MRRTPHGLGTLRSCLGQFPSSDCWRVLAGAAVGMLAFASLVGFGPAPLSSAAAVAPGGSSGYWVGIDHAAIRLDPDTGAVQKEISLSASPLAIATGRADGSLDVLAPPSLERFAPDGTPLLTVDLRTLAPAISDARLLQLDPYDGSLWVANATTVVRLGTQGNAVADWTATSAIVSIAVDVDESLWVLTQDALVHLSSIAGQLTLSPLSGVLSPPRYLALDTLGKRVLVADASQVLKFDPADLSAPPEVAGTSADHVADGGSAPAIVGIAAHPLFGTLWVATAQSLRIFDRSGSLLKTIDLGPYNIGPISALAFDFDDGSLWLGASRAVGRFRSNGDFVARLALPAPLATLGTPSFKLAPRLSLVSPADGALVNGAGLTLNYGLGGDCNGVLCFPDGDYADALNLDVRLNGHPLGPPYRSAPFEASFSIGAFAQPGTNNVTAQATDRYGHVSSRLSSSFRIGGSSIASGSPSATAGPAMGTSPATAGGATSPSVPSGSGGSSQSSGGQIDAVSQPKATTAAAKAAFAHFLMSFELNKGQIDASARYLTLQHGYAFSFTPDAAVMVLKNPNHPANGPPGDAASPAPQRLGGHLLKKPELNSTPAPSGPAYATVRMRFVGGNSSPRIEGVGELKAKSNYLIGNDRNQWVRDVPHYARVIYHDVYPGVDQEFYFNGNALEYNLIVQPGVDPSRIAIAFDGARPNVTSAGDIELKTALGSVVHRRPASYQQVGGQRTTVESGYVVHSDGTIGITIRGNDPNRPVVIDPEIVYSTFLGGGAGGINDVAVGPDGSAYLVGETNSGFSLGGPLNSDALNATSDAYVVKLSTDGQSVLYATYFGGSGGRFYSPTLGIYYSGNYATALAVDSTGSAVVVGETTSPSFPLKNAWQSSLGGKFDVFVSKLNPAGNDFVYSTYMGGSDWDRPYDVAVDSSGAAWVVGDVLGATQPTNFPTTLGGTGYGFVFKLDANGVLLQSMLNNAREDSVAVDAGGNAYTTGITGNASYPVVGPIPGSSCPGLFITKFDPSMKSMLYSTCVAQLYTWEGTTHVAVDGNASAYVAGSTVSTTYPVVNAFQTTNRVATAGYYFNAYITKLSPAGNSLVYSSYLGSSVSTTATGISTDGQGNAYIAGTNSTDNTGNSDFPTTSPIAGSTCASFYEAKGFVTEVAPSGSLVFSTCLGGGDGTALTYSDVASVAVDGLGAAYIAGWARALDFPLVNPLFTTDNAGPYVMKIGAATQTPTTTALSTSASTIVLGQPVTFTATVTGNNPTGTVAFLDGGNTLGTAALVGNTATYTTTTLIGGMHTVTATYGGDAQNGPSTSAPVSVMVNAPPTVSIVTPLNGGTFINGATVTAVANANVVGGTVAQVAIYNGATLLTTATESPYTYTFSSLSPGTYTLTAKATSTAGLSTTSAPVTITVIGSPRLQITNPAAGSFITSATAVVTGTVQTPPNSSLQVQVQQPKGGATTTVWATITPDGRFFANNVPLYTGPNIITVTLTAPGGATITRTVTVTRNGQAGFTFSANPTEGLAPLSVYFTLTNTGGTAFDHIDFTCQDGGAVQTVQGPSTVLNPCTYSTPGYYTAQVNVYALPVGTSQAPIFTGVQMIQADSAVTVNAVALGAYYDMLNQLLAGNVQGALNDVTGTVYAKYNAVFTSVVTDPNLKTIIPKQFMNIVDGTIGDGYAEYVLSRNVNGVATGFFIDVLQGEDGVWRIEGM